MAVAALRAVLRSRSPQRTVLAEKIAEVQSLKDRLAVLRDAQDRAQEQSFAINRQIEAAEKAIAELRPTENRELVEAFVSGKSAPPAQLREALTAIELLRSEQETVRRTREALSAEIEKAESYHLFFAEMAKDNAIGAVLASDPAVFALLDRFNAARLEARTCLEAMLVVSPRFGARNTLPESLQRWGSEPDWHADPKRPDLADATRWRDALASLALDANTPLPE
jgi:hypothetical protein